MRETEPWKFLDAYRGRVFSDRWPTIPQLFDITTDRFPDRACFTIYSPQRMSTNYRETHEIILKVASYLTSIGLGPGSHIAVTGKNSPEWGIAYIAVLYTGAVVVPIDYQLSTQDIITLMHAGDVTAAFVDEEKYEHIKKDFAGIPCFGLARGVESFIYDF